MIWVVLSLLVPGLGWRGRAEFQLDLAVRNDTHAASQDVINIRACTAQADDRVIAANSPDVTQAGTSLGSELNAV
jgi:hypothetical protein